VTEGSSAESLVWLHDRLVPAGVARVSVFDAGFRSGEGVFETFRAYGDHPFRLAAHLDRAEDGAAALDLTLPPRDLLVRAVRETAVANAGPGDRALRLTVTPGEIDPLATFPSGPSGPPTLVVTAHPLAPLPAIEDRGVRVASVARVREVPTVKAVSYLTASLARREASARGAGEAILVDDEGDVREGSYSNVFAVSGGELRTPPVGSGILPGVTRAVVIELARAAGIRVREVRLSLDDLRGADEVLLTATTREVVPVTAVDDAPVGDGAPGAITRLLAEAYREEVLRETVATRGGAGS
jgi:branched-subunit amino acid aminotransferase/4-amino-4-deoxychorismate lyase